jgi:hypothetical protein
MTKSDGTCKVNGVALGEVTMNLLGHSIELGAKYALCNFESHDRFGAGNRNSNWSADTMEKLKSLVDSMERDICRDLFLDGTTIGSADDVVDTQQDGVPGL